MEDYISTNVMGIPWNKEKEDFILKCTISEFFDFIEKNCDFLADKNKKNGDASYTKEDILETLNFYKEFENNPQMKDANPIAIKRGLSILKFITLVQIRLTEPDMFKRKLTKLAATHKY